MLISPLAPPRPSISSEKPEAEHERPLPRQRGDPAEQAAAAAQAAGDLERRADGEDGQQGRHRDHAGEHRVQELEAGADLRVGKQMMDADRHREDQQLQEGDAAHLVAVQAPAGGLRQQHVEARCRPGSARSRRWRAASTRTAAAPARRRSWPSSRRRWAGSGRRSPRRRPATSRPTAARRRWWRTSPAAPAAPDGRASSARSARPSAPIQIHEPTTAIRMPR